MTEPITRLNAALEGRYRIERQPVSKRGRDHALLSAALLLLLTHALTAPSKAAGQTSPAVSVGERVRLTTFTGQSYTGVVTALMPRAIELRADGPGEPITVDNASLARLEVRREQSMGGLGLLVGAAAGALGAVAFCKSDEQNCVWVDFNGGRSDFNSEFPLILGGVGAVVGFVIGRRMRSEAWQNVPLESLQVSLVPQRDGGLALGISLRH